MYTSRVIGPTGEVAFEVNPINEKFTFFEDFSDLPIFFKASKKRTSVELPESINTYLTSYPSISVVITKASSWGTYCAPF